MAARSSSSTDRPQRRRLGRGLDSLIGGPIQVEVPTDKPSADAESAASRSYSPQDTSAHATAAGSVDGEAGLDGLRRIALEAIVPNPRQPRQQFDEAALRSLADSIRTAGLMQPVVVRPSAVDPERFELIAGERRWRAAGLIGLKQLPAVVRSIDDETAAQWALIENLQREDLNPIERAEAFQRLADDFQLTHQQIAERVGLDRTSITNHLRLLELSSDIREQISAGGLTLGHGKSLLAITSKEARRRLAQQAARQQWSVRELERRVRRACDRDESAERSGPASSRERVHMQDLERQLGEHLGTKVHVQPGRKKGAGSLTIAFYSFEQFEGLLERLGFDAR